MPKTTKSETVKGASEILDGLLDGENFYTMKEILGKYCRSL